MCKRETKGKASIQCVTCAGWVHLTTGNTPADKQCTPITKQETINKVTIMNFRCGECRLNHSIREDEDAGPEVEVNPNEDPKSPSANGNTPRGNPKRDLKVTFGDGGKITGIKKMEEMLKKLEDLPNETDLSKQIDVLTHSMTFIARQYDIIVELQKRVSVLEGRVKTMKRIEPASNTGNRTHEPHPARRDVIISPVPKVQGEDTLKVSLEVLKLVGCDTEAVNIESVERFRSKASSLPHYIKIRFKNEDMKIKAIKGSRAKKIKVGQLVDNIESNLSHFTDASKLRLSYNKSDVGNWSIFINESVSKECKKVLDAALLLKKSGKLLRVWTQNNRVHVVEKEGNNPVAVHSITFLERTYGPIPETPVTLATDQVHARGSGEGEDNTVYTD